MYILYLHRRCRPSPRIPLPSSVFNVLLLASTHTMYIGYGCAPMSPVYLHRYLMICMYMTATYATPVQEISANAMMTTRVIRFPLCRASSPSTRVLHINIYTQYNTLHRRTIGVTQRNVPITRLYWSLRRNFNRHTDALEPKIPPARPPCV